MVTVLTATSVRVTWADPQLDSITHYDISYSLAGNRKRQAQSERVNAPATSADIDGLMNNRQYDFQVTAVAIIDGTEIVGTPSVMERVLVMTTGSPGNCEYIYFLVLIISTYIYINVQFILKGHFNFFLSSL